MIRAAVSTQGSLQPQDFPSTDRFHIQRRLGEGAAGVVFHATDRERGIDVALKTLRKVDPLALYRFKREFRALADVVHPNLAGLYELMAEGGDWFFTMELVDGIDFLTDVRPRGRFDEAKLRRELLQLARGVDAIHQAGKLHRDIKPSNVLVTRTGRVVILDFGLVTELGPAKELGGRPRICGTAGYMAPEQAGARPLTEACDWYAVGVILYEALTGRLPFTGTIDTVLKDKQVFEPRPPRSIDESVPSDLDRLAVELLRTRPEERPLGQAILERLEAEEVRVKASRPSDPDNRGPHGFVGRDEALSALFEVFEETKLGDTRVVFVRGASGMGKSALIRCFLDTIAEQRSATILEGRCYERESVPFKAFDSVVDALCDHLLRLKDETLAKILPDDIAFLARLFPVLSRLKRIADRAGSAAGVLDPLELRRRAFASLRTLLIRMSQEKPVVIGIDDIQWGDADTAALLLDVLRPPRAPSLMLVAGHRDEDDQGDGPIAKLARGLKDAARRARLLSTVPRPMARAQKLAVRDVVLGRLSDAEARELAYRLLGSSLKRSLVIAAESRGNPFFVIELARFVQERIDGGAELASREISLDDLLRERIEALDERARTLLELIAVAARPIGQAAVFAAFDPPNDELEALRVLRAQHLVKTHGGRIDDDVEVFHDRVREAAQRRIPPERLRAHHLRLLEVLERDPSAPVETLAYHAEGAGDRARAAEHTIRAAENAHRMLAFEHAARLYRGAFSLDPSARERPDLVLRLADALANAGRGHEAALAYLEAAEQEPLHAIDIQRRAAEQFLRSGHVDEGLEQITFVLKHLGMRVSKTPKRAIGGLLLERARLRMRGTRHAETAASDIAPADLTKIDVCWSVAVGLGMIDVLRSTEFQARHLRLALDAGEPYRVARGLCAEAMALSTQGRARWPRVELLFREARAIADRIDNPHAKGFWALTYGMAHNLKGEWRAGLSHLSHALDVFESRCTGVAWETSTAEHMSIWALAYLGAIPELHERVPRALAEAERRGDLYATTLLMTGLPNWSWLAADDVEGARDAAAEAIAHWSQRGFHLQHYNALLAQTNLDLYLGDGAQALDRLRQKWRALEDSMLLEIQQLRIEAEHLHARARLAALASAKPEERARHLTKIERIQHRLLRTGAPWALPLADLVGAGVAEAKGLGDRALRLYENARLGFFAQDMMLYAQVAERRKGELVGAEEGASMVRASDQWMAQANIRRPPRFADMLAPVSSQSGS